LGVAAGRKQEFVLASHQFVYAMLLHPNWADARPKLRAAVIGMTGTDDGRKHLRELFSLVSDSSVILNDLAWLLATHPDAAVRDGKAAVELVERALAAKNAGINPTLLSTAAAAYAETGRFDTAINKAEQALALARASGNEQIATLSESLLASFQTMRPYRDNPR
jgi:tetratricopeptide (TPR) repeat protein